MSEWSECHTGNALERVMMFLFCTDGYCTDVNGTCLCCCDILGNVKGTKASDVEERVVRIGTSSSVAARFIMVITLVMSRMTEEKNEWARRLVRLIPSSLPIRREMSCCFLAYTDCTLLFKNANHFLGCKARQGCVSECPCLLLVLS